MSISATYSLSKLGNVVFKDNTGAAAKTFAIFYSEEADHGFYMQSLWSSKVMHRIQDVNYPEEYNMPKAIGVLCSTLRDMLGDYNVRSVNWNPVEEDGLSFTYTDPSNALDNSTLYMASVITGSEKIQIGEDRYEDDCAVCFHCGSVHPAHEMYRDGNGVYACKDCMSGDDVFICNDCGTFMDSDDLCHATRFVWGSRQELSVCESCLDDHYIECSDCGEYVHVDNIELENDELHICYGCSDNWRRCVECGHIGRDNDMYYDEDDDEYFCDYCWSHRAVRIREYSYKPEPIFQRMDIENGNVPECIYMGVELEVDHGNNRDACVSDIASEYQSNLYIKRDGSLDNGFEIVTHPATLGYHMNRFPWRHVCDTAVRYDFKSHNTSTCGLHVHVNRTCLGNVSDERDLSIAKIALLMERFWDPIVKFTRRDSGALNRWSRKVELDLVRGESESKMAEKIANNTDDRYVALNLCNRHTIEFRIFRGTLKRSTIMATLQFVHNIVDYARSHTVQEVMECSWNDFVFCHQFDELAAYLNERSIDSPSAKELFFSGPILDNSKPNFSLGQIVSIRRDISSSPAMANSFPEVIPEMEGYAGERHIVARIDHEASGEYRYHLSDIPDYFWLASSLEGVA